ncbi:MAG: zinc ribbon domain-containing protein [Anaerolineae bacterium]
MECVSCKQPIPLDTQYCPRCGADNTEWQRLQQRSGLGQWLDFFDSTVWAHIFWIVVLGAALLMLTAAFFAVQSGLFWFLGALLAVSLCTAFYLLAFGWRWSIREYEWLRKQMARWRPPVRSLVVVSFLLGTLLLPVAALLPGPVSATPAAAASDLPPVPEGQNGPTAIFTPRPTSTFTPAPIRPREPEPDPPITATPPPDGKGALPSSMTEPWLLSAASAAVWPVSALLAPSQNQEMAVQPQGTALDLGNRLAPVLLGIALGLYGLGFGLAADLSFASWLNRRLPRPIFADRSRLARVLRREAEFLLRSGQKERNWGTQRRYERFEHDQDQFEITQEQIREFYRSMPPEDLSSASWLLPEGQENVHVKFTNQAPGEARDSWEIWENRPAMEVQIEAMERTDDGGMRIQIAVLADDVEKAMRQDGDTVHLRLRGLSHYELTADLWGWPTELSETDDYRLVQVVRRDVSVIDPPEAIPLPKLEEAE